MAVEIVIGDADEVLIRFEELVLDVIWVGRGYRCLGIECTGPFEGGLEAAPAANIVRGFSMADEGM